MKQKLLLSQEQFTNWLIALRSGKYNQGTSLLKTKNKKYSIYSHCCLGVLCEVSGFKFDDTCGYYQDEVTLCRSSHAFPSPDFITKNPIVITTTEDEHEFVKLMKDKTGYSIANEGLSSINDSCKFTFDDIADIIEMFFEPAHL